MKILTYTWQWPWYAAWHSRGAGTEVLKFRLSFIYPAFPDLPLFFRILLPPLLSPSFAAPTSYTFGRLFIFIPLYLNG